MNPPDDHAIDLTIEQLAEATTTSIDDVEHWGTLGLIGAPGGLYRSVDIERVRLIQFVQQRGIDPDAIVRASQTQGHVLGHYVEMITDNRVRGGRSLEDAAAVTGLEPRVLDRLWAA